MSWCSNCKAEYMEGITTCPDCGHMLKDHKQKDKAGMDTMVAMEPTLLFSISNQTEESMIVSLLEDANIPILVKNRGVGGYMKIYMGFSVYGSEIYVDKNDFQKAKDIIDDNFAQSNSEDVETEILSETDVVTHKLNDSIKLFPISKQWVARLILIIMLLTIIIAFVVNNV